MTDNKPLLDIPKATTRAGLAKNIGRRLRAAREIAGIPQSVAAKRLGYANSSKLAKIEGGTDTNSVPHWMILRAARIYEVSIDYLYGESDDWELSSRACQERDVSKWVFETWEAARQRDMDVLRKLVIRFDAINSSVTTMFLASQDVNDAMTRFIELNSESFEDMRGGARLVSAIHRLLDVTGNCRMQVTRYRRECEVSGIGAAIVSKSDQPKLL